MPDIKDPVSDPHPGQIQPSPVLNIGSPLEAESYFRSPYYRDSYYFPWNPDPLCPGNNYSIYDDMEDDDQVKVALSFKKDIVVNSGWKIDCNRPDVVEFVTDSLKRMQEEGSMQMSFEDSVRDMLGSYAYGFSLTEPVFKIKNGMYVFDSIRTRPPQSFRFSVSPKGDVTEVVQMTNDGEKFFSPKIFLHHTYQAQYGNPYGKSDLRGAYTSWKAKKFVTKFLAIYLERFASPTPVARYPSNWDSDQISALVATVKNIQQTTSLVIPEGTLIDFVQNAKDSSDAYIRALDYYNIHIARALLVPDLLGISGEKTKGGSFALGQDQFKLFLASVEKDRVSLARKITLRLISPLVAANFGPGIKCDFSFINYSMDDRVELLKVWGDVIKGNVYKPTEQEINHFRKELKFPEGPVVLGNPTPAGGEVGGEKKPPEQAPQASQFGLKRSPTNAERKVNFAQIKESLDGSEAEMGRRLKRCAKQIWTDYVSQIKDTGLIERFDPKRLTELKPRFLKDMNIELKHCFRDLLSKSHAEAKRELFPNAKFSLDEGELDYEDMIQVLDAESFNIPKDYSGIVSKKVNSDIVQGLKQGLSTEEIVGMIRDDMPDLTDNWINTLVRTKTTEIYNRGRKSYFDNDPLAQSVIGAYQFSAVMDNRTTEVCSSLDKKVFASDDDNINLLTPPLHFNCRSIIVPVTNYEKDTMDEVEDAPDRGSLQDMGAGLLSVKADVRGNLEGGKS